MAAEGGRGRDAERTWSRRYERPYAMIGGRARTGAHADLEIEALVSATDMAERSLPLLTRERRSIVELCRGAVAIAEIASLLDVPLGVARILVGDMADEGLLLLHRPTDPIDHPDPDLLRRVLHGLSTI
jgi:Protein of unknown function (DUF742)